MLTILGITNDYPKIRYAKDFLSDIFGVDFVQVTETFKVYHG